MMLLNILFEVKYIFEFIKSSKQPVLFCHKQTALMLLKSAFTKTRYCYSVFQSNYTIKTFVLSFLFECYKTRNYFYQMFDLSYLCIHYN